jgi:hypothetical protein
MSEAEFIDNKEITKVCDEIAFDYQAPIGDIGHLCSVAKLLEYQSPKPFLNLNNSRSNDFKNKNHFLSDKFVCGISWKSANKDIGSVKSLNLIDVSPLLSIYNVEFVSYATLGAGTGQVSSLNDLTDVTLTGITTGNILAYNGSEFVNTSNINVTGIITATSFVGDGSGLTGAGSTVFNNTTTNQEFFPLFTSTTSGTITASGISTSKLKYNPSTGTMTAVDFNSTSDINLKENIHTVGNALEITEQLRGVSFDWKETGRSSYGVIAQELEEVLPELVKQGEVKSVNYNGIIGVLIEAIKELKKEVKELKIDK